MTVPTSNRDELRQAVAQRIGDCFAVALSGNRMPHMSGDPRARLLPHQLRELEDCAASAADAAIAAYERHRPDVVLTREKWDAMVERAYQAQMYRSNLPMLWEGVDAGLRAAFSWIRVEDK